MRRFHVVRAFAVAVVASVATSACGGAATPSAPPVQSQPFSAALNWPSTSDGALGGNTSDFGLFGNWHTIVATAPFVGTRYADIGLVTDQVSFAVAGPSGVEQIRKNPVTWTVSPPIATTTAAVPDLTAMLGPTVILTATAPGRATLTATAVGPPQNVSVSAVLVVYPVVDVGCVDGGALGGVSFNQDGTYTAQATPGASDLYVTGPDCSGAFRDSTATSDTVHTPYGATLVADSNVMGDDNVFPYFPPTLWKSSFTALDEAQWTAAYQPQCPPPVYPTPAPCQPANSVLFLKTARGAIVKMQTGIGLHGTTSGKNVEGAYVTTDASGNFPY